MQEGQKSLGSTSNLLRGSQTSPMGPGTGGEKSSLSRVRSMGDLQMGTHPMRLQSPKIDKTSILRVIGHNFSDKKITWFKSVSPPRKNIVFRFVSPPKTVTASCLAQQSRVSEVMLQESAIKGANSQTSVGSPRKPYQTTDLNDSAYRREKTKTDQYSFGHSLQNIKQ